MMTTNDTDNATIPQASMPAPLSRNVQNMINFMTGASTSANNEDVATMNDAQFCASLDALFDVGGSSSPPAYDDNNNNTAATVPVAVSAGPSAASSVASSIASSLPQQQQATTTSSSSAGKTASFSRPQTVMFPARRGLPGPSPLTARLAFSFPTAPSPAPSNISSVSTASRWNNTSTTPTPVTSSSTTTTLAGTKRSRSEYTTTADIISEDGSEKSRQKRDRNIREQQRSHRITEQIAHLRNVLSEAQVAFKPDKYSTLVGVADYIKQLQARSAMLDAEHKKVLSTIQQTNDMVNNNNNNKYVQASTDNNSDLMGSDTMSDAAVIASSDVESLPEEYGVFVKDLDYKGVFSQNCVAMAVASIDGRFLDCNEAFERLIGLSRDELLPYEAHAAAKSTSSALKPMNTPSDTDNTTPRNLSLFNLLTQDDMEEVFMAMSTMLKKPNGGAASHADSSPPDYWTGVVRQSRQQDEPLTMNVTLVRSHSGRPKFFNCALTPVTRTPF